MNKIEWNGGECPVPNGTDITIFFRNGYMCRDREPQDWWWSHNNDVCDIVAYINHDDSNIGSTGK
ncbi:MAG: hypothetical protein ACPGF7_09445 [Pontibacterium sp.]